MVTPILRSTRQRGVRGLTPVEEPKKTLAPVKEPLRVMNPEIEAYNIDNVSTAAPLALNPQPTPVIETRSLLDGNVSQNPSDPTKPNLARTAPTIQQTGQPIIETDPAAEIKAAGEAGNLTTELGTQRANLEGEITALQEKMANVPAGVAASKERLGINKDKELLRGLNEQLSGVKQDLLAAQDQQTEISELGRQKISDFGGTSRDFGQLTNAEQRKNQLDQLALSRTFSRLGDTASSIQASINDNVSIINEQAKAEQSKIEFDINQKNKILDRVIQTQGSILSGEQAQRLEAVKQANALELATHKAQLDNIAAGAKTLALGGSNGNILNEYMSTDDPDARSSLALKAYMNKEIDAGDLLKIQADNAEEKREIEAKKVADAAARGVAVEKAAADNAASNAVIKRSDSLLTSVNKLLYAASTTDREGNAKSNTLDDILGSFDQFDLIGTWGDEEKTNVAALEHIFSDATVESLSKMKGNPSDKDMEVVEQMARQGFNRAIGDSTGLVEMLTTMKEGLEDARLIESSAIQRRNSALEAENETIDDVESLLEDEVSLPEGVDFDKLVSIESSGTGDYTAVNPTTGAYGKYQFIPTTLNYYANKMGITEQQAKTPQGQEAMFKEFTKDNVAGLESAGIPVNTVTVYLAHQQGLGGARQIASGNISPEVRRNLLANLPAGYDGLSNPQLINAWGQVFLPKLT